MSMKVTSYCGTDCSTCEFKEKENCPGCKKAKGKMFWGSCDIAKCCIEKKHEHCGVCEEFPCKILNDYSYDKENGDNGKRIENLKKLIKEK